jgi:hypothetical protein
MRKLLWVVAAIAVLAILAGNASATIISYEDFGPGPYGVGTGDLGPVNGGVTITSVADPTAPGGGYATFTNDGYGYGAGSAFGLTAANTAAAYSSPYAESVTMYLNPALTGSSSPAPAFTLNILPTTNTGATGWSSAQDLVFSTTGTGALSMSAGNTAYGAGVFPVGGTISTAGWYTFQVGLYQVSPYWGGPYNVAADFNVYNSLGYLISSLDDVNTAIVTSDLGGPGYNAFEFPYDWDPTYSPAGLAILGVAEETYTPSPDVGSYNSDFNLYPAAVTATPEPISMIFFGTGLVAVSGYMARRKMARKA